MAEPERIAEALGEWFPTAKRDLSWRRTRDPYAIWVSEIMLQQTRVETVENYYQRFLARFPDVGTLAAADEHSVLEAWSGLGYYRRARLLHAGARFVVEHHDGEVPDNAPALREIPGIGAYTAGAIASIAFDQPEALVDGNVARVFSRLNAIEDPQLQDQKAKAHWQLAAEVLEHGSPRVLAQAMMELGATVCTPKNPRCLVCPIREQCRAYELGRQAEIPAPKQKKASPEFHYWALGVAWGGKLLLERRPKSGLLAGLWCLPLIEGEGERAPARAASRTLGVPVRFDDSPTDPVKHVFTHRVWHLLPWRCVPRRRPKIRGRKDGRELCWIDPGERPVGGIPSLTEKLLARFQY